MVEKIKESLGNIEGPLLVGTLWVKWHGNTMKLPVWIVSAVKLECAMNKLCSPYTKKSIENLKDFVPVVLEGMFNVYMLGSMVTYLTSIIETGVMLTYNFIIRKSDIENLKKEKVS